METVDWWGELMEAVISGVCVGVVMLMINGIVMLVRHRKADTKIEVETTMSNKQKIMELEKKTDETKELVKLTLATCIILGDGMVQNGINGDFKKAFCEKKQDALRML